MNTQKPIYCPKCNKLLDKRELNDGELIKKHCEKCGIDWIFEVEITLKQYKELIKTEQD